MVKKTSKKCDSRSTKSEREKDWRGYPFSVIHNRKILAPSFVTNVELFMKCDIVELTINLKKTYE